MSTPRPSTPRRRRPALAPRKRPAAPPRKTPRRTPPKPRPPLTAILPVHPTITPHPLSPPATQPNPHPVSHPVSPPPPPQPSQPPQPPQPPPPSQPSPQPPANLERIIDDACRFILARKQTHAAGIAWEVGEYLFERVYRGDVEYVSSRDSNKTDSLRDIAARTGIGPLRLMGWIRAYVARKYLRPAGIDVDLSMSDFEALRPLAFHPDAARAVLELRDRHHLTGDQLDALAVDWKRRLDEGGRLEDLLAAPLPPTISPRPKPSHAPRPLADPDLVPIRLTQLVLRWVRSTTLAPTSRSSLAREVSRLRSLVASSSSPPPPDQQLAPSAQPTTNDNQPPPIDLVAAAVRFIQACLRRHGLQFALEVGEYLFRNVYHGDRTQFRSGGTAWQQDTIKRIARDRRVRLDDSFLYKCIHVFLLTGQVAAAAPAGQLPELPVTTWDDLWALEDNPQALVAVSAWAAAERVPTKTVAAVAFLVAPYLAQGGSLDDLLAGSQRRPPDTPYRRIRRILAAVASHLARRPLSSAARPRLVAALDAVLSALDGSVVHQDDLVSPVDVEWSADR
ncbi:MAG: hypothetical protein HY905_12080 [Deltaproteobacteria bacterium]|nr:hypothetical protein [Deltaproteobacteria bacterium]